MRERRVDEKDVEDGDEVRDVEKKQKEERCGKKDHEISGRRNDTEKMREESKGERGWFGKWREKGRKLMITTN